SVDSELQSNVFFFRMQITGTVFNDFNENGIRDPGEPGITGRIIQLIDQSGTVIAQTTTGAGGRYSFDNLAFGLEPSATYSVREVLPTGVFQTTVNPAPLTFTRGETFSQIDFGNYSGPRWDWHGPADSAIVNLGSEPGNAGGVARVYS